MNQPRFDVLNCGTDSSGRTIWMTRYMAAFIDAVKADHRVAPFADLIVVTQGAFMLRDGGGAAASSNYHDYAGCVDFRTYTLTTDHLNAFIRVCRENGAAAWRRDASHGGMDAHCHVTLGGDHSYSSGASASWASYVNGGNGLVSGSDYEWRPSPLVHEFNYAKHTKENDMPTVDDLLSAKLGGDNTVKDALQAALQTQKALATFRVNARAANVEQADVLAQILADVSDDASADQLHRARAALKDRIDSLRTTTAE